MKITKFDDITVSTKTFTTYSNINIDIAKLFNVIPITPYKIEQKKRGRKKKDTIQVKQPTLEYGSVVTVKYQDKLRGVDLKQSKGKKRWFRNSVTIVLVLNKHINIKVCKNGTLQMTGCKFDNDSVNVVKYIWNILKTYNLYSFKNKDDEIFYTYIIPSMRNIDFDVGFNIDRDKLNEYMLKHMNYHCILETSFGYTAVNIKMKLKNDVRNMNITKLTFKHKTCKQQTVKYKEYLGKLSSKEYDAKINSKRYTTFLVFHSGKIIMSGLTREFMKNEYNNFVSIISRIENVIKEQLLI